MPSVLCKRYLTDPCIIPHRVLHRIPSGKNGCMAIEISHSGLLLAAACDDVAEFPIRIYNIDSAKCLCLLSSHRGLVYSIQWSEDDSKLLSCSADGTIRIHYIQFEIEAIEKKWYMLLLKRSISSFIVLPNRLQCA